MGKVKLNYDKMTNDEILELFKDQYYKIQPNDALDFFKKSNNTPSQYILKTRLKMSYGETVVAIGARKTIRKHYAHGDITFDKWKKRMDLMVKDLGHVPSSTEILKKYNVSISMITNELGLTFEEFINKCGYKYKRYKNDFFTNSQWMNKNDNEIFKAYKELCNKLGRTATAKDVNNAQDFYTIAFIRKRYKSFNNFKRLAGITYRVDDLTWYSKAKITKMLIDLYVKYKRRLTTTELIEEYKNEDLPTVTTIQAYFKKTNFIEIWEEIEQEMLKDYIKIKQHI